MDISLPSRDALKAQAKRLRTDLASSGTTISHAQALEMVAHQWGAKDWNTLSAKSGDTPQHRWHPGQRVNGRYLGHPFRGHIKSASQASGGWWHVTVRFDDPVDVVTSDAFSNFRRQVDARLRENGRSVEKTADGTPHMELLDNWHA